MTTLRALFAAALVALTFGIAVAKLPAPPPPTDEQKAAAEDKKEFDMFGYVVRGGEVVVGPVRQTGVFPDAVASATVAAELGARRFAIGALKVDLLLCGEILSRSWRDGLAQARPDLVVHLAHASVRVDDLGRRSWRRAVEDVLSRSRAAWAFCDHTARPRHVHGAARGPGLVRGRNARLLDGAIDGGWLSLYEIDA